MPQGCEPTKVSLVVSESCRALGSRSEGPGFDPRPMLGGSGAKAMPGSIPASNSYRKIRKYR